MPKPELGLSSFLDFSLFGVRPFTRANAFYS